MTVLSTMVSLGTLAGLLGTVTGMIKAFSALSAAGTQIKLLLQMVFVNNDKLFHICTPIVVYNFFTYKIDT
jgi:biopolymer transport protein ExbB